MMKTISEQRKNVILKNRTLFLAGKARTKQGTRGKCAFKGLQYHSSGKPKAYSLRANVIRV